MPYEKLDDVINAYKQNRMIVYAKCGYTLEHVVHNIALVATLLQFIPSLPSQQIAQNPNPPPPNPTESLEDLPAKRMHEVLKSLGITTKNLSDLHGYYFDLGSKNYDVYLRINGNWVNSGQDGRSPFLQLLRYYMKFMGMPFVKFDYKE